MCVLVCSLDIQIDMSGGATVVKVALDWTPNTNHTGFYVAREKGMYNSVDLQVEFLGVHDDGYKVTPAQKVLQGLADVAITPKETIIRYARRDILTCLALWKGF